MVIPTEIPTREDRLKALLDGVTQAEAARRMGISAPQLNRLFKGSRAWKKRDVRAFSIALKVKMADLHAVLNGHEDA
jgi:transcriptional regulator with XRE-family HTH domain